MLKDGLFQNKDTLLGSWVVVRPPPRTIKVVMVGQEEHTERRKKIQTAATQQLKLNSCWTPLLVCLVLALALTIIRNEKK